MLEYNCLEATKKISLNTNGYVLGGIYTNLFDQNYDYGKQHKDNPNEVEKFLKELRLFPTDVNFEDENSLEAFKNYYSSLIVYNPKVFNAEKNLQGFSSYYCILLKEKTIIPGNSNSHNPLNLIYFL